MVATGRTCSCSPGPGGGLGWQLRGGISLRGKEPHSRNQIPVGGGGRGPQAAGGAPPPPTPGEAAGGGHQRASGPAVRTRRGMRRTGEKRVPPWAPPHFFYAHLTVSAVVWGEVRAHGASSPDKGKPGPNRHLTPPSCPVGPLHTPYQHPETHKGPPRHLKESRVTLRRPPPYPSQSRGVGTESSLQMAAASWGQPVGAGGL